MHMLSMTYIQQHYNEQIWHKTAKNKKFYNNVKKNDKLKISRVALEQPTNYRILYTPTIYMLLEHLKEIDPTTALTGRTVTN